jgi:hypothetical protein
MIGALSMKRVLRNLNHQLGGLRIHGAHEEPRRAGATQSQLPSAGVDLAPARRPGLASVSTSDRQRSRSPLPGEGSSRGAAGTAVADAPQAAALSAAGPAAAETARSDSLRAGAGASTASAPAPMTAQEVDEAVNDALGLVETLAHGADTSQPQGLDHQTYAQERAAHFRSMVDLIGGLAQQGRIMLGDREMRELCELEHAAWQMQQHARGESTHAPERRSLHERLIGYFTGPSGADAAFHQRLRDLVQEQVASYELDQMERRGRRALMVLVEDHLPILISEMKDTASLGQLAQDLVAQLRSTGGPAAREVSPAFARAQAALAKSIEQDIRLAGAECAVQKEMLQTLALAGTELGEGKIEGLRGGLNHLARRGLRPAVVHHIGGDARPRAEQVRASLEQHFGGYLSVGLDDGNHLDAQVKPGAPGQVSTAEFERQLSALLEVRHPRLIGRVVRGAADGNPDFEVAKGHQVRLSPEASARLADLALAGAGPAATPHEHASRKAVLQGVVLAAINHVRDLLGQGSPGDDPGLLDSARRVFGGVLHIGHDPHTGRIHAAPRDEWAASHPDVLVHELNRQLRAPQHADDRAAVESLAGALKGNAHLGVAGGAEGAALQVHRHGAELLPQTPPRERLAEAAGRALEAVQVGVLKVSLLSSFDAVIVGRAATADDVVPWHRELRQAKDELVDRTLEQLMACSDRSGMLACVAQAQRDHEALWRDTWKRPNGGRTAEVLQDLHTAVERF